MERKVGGVIRCVFLKSRLLNAIEPIPGIKMKNMFFCQPLRISDCFNIYLVESHVILHLGIYSVTLFLSTCLASN